MDFRLATLKRTIIFSVMNLFFFFYALSCIKESIQPSLVTLFLDAFLDESFKSWRIVLHIKKVVTRIVQKAPKFTFTLSYLVSLKAVGD